MAIVMRSVPLHFKTSCINNAGPLMIGVLFAMVLYGCTCAQVLYYIWHFPEDSSRVKALVLMLWMLETLTTVSDIEVLWYYYASGHANISRLQVADQIFLSMEFALSAVIVLIVQCFYIHKVWKLHAGMKLIGPMSIAAVVTVLAYCSCGFYIANVLTRDALYAVVVVKSNIPACIQPALAVITDIYISAALVWGLRRETPAYRSTQMLIQKLTIYAVNRGILLAIAQLLALATYLAFNREICYWQIFHYPLSKLYVISFLSILNSRHRLGNSGSVYFSDGLLDIPMELLNDVMRSPETIAPSRSQQASSGQDVIVML